MTPKQKLRVIALESDVYLGDMEQSKKRKVIRDVVKNGSRSSPVKALRARMKKTSSSGLFHRLFFLI